MFVAADAVPFRLAVIAPAEKLPDESRATMVETVSALVASLVIVTLAPPL
jgi:hypothetical protein